MAGKPGNSAQRTSAARLAAVQSLYEIEISGSSDNSVMMDLLEKRWQRLDEDADLGDMDKAKFSALVRGVRSERNRLDEMVSGALDKGRDLDRLDVLLKSVLRAGVYELYEETRVPTAVIINEYVEVAHAFYAEGEPALVNAVLDKLGKLIRAA